jgi:outer membrane biosynthesis protein TonB
MRTIHRVMLLTVLATFAPALTACSDFDMDKLDVFGLNEKKKLPGERKEVFPGGVPGVTQGIPPEFVKGNQPPPEAAQTPAQATEPDKKTAAVEPEPKPKPKRPPKPRTVSQPAQITVQPAPQQQPAPWPQDQQPAQQQSQAPWPAQGQTNTAAPWPSSPQPGTFSR